MTLFAHQLRVEQLVFWRGRESAVFVFLFPVLLFLLLGTVYDGTYRGRPIADYLVAGLLGYGVANTAFGGLGISLVIRRELGILKRIRGTPLPAPTYMAAALSSILLVFALQAVTIVALGRLLHGADVLERWPSLVLALAYSAVVFAAMGLAIASLIRSAEGASAVVNVIVLPMAFLSGGFGPTREFPEALQTVADALPLTYVIDLVTGIVFEGEAFWTQPGPLAVLALWGAVGAAVASRRFRWEPRER